MSRGAPRPLSDALATALERVAPATLLAAVQSAWAEAVGPAIAAQASPIAERDGVVTVACSAATWAQELDLLGEEIVTRLRAQLPPRTTLRGLRFIATGERG